MTNSTRTAPAREARTEGPAGTATPVETPPATQASATTDGKRRHARAFYAEARRHVGRTDDAHAFIRDPSERPGGAQDDLAEALGEDFVRSATSGEEAGQEAGDEVITEEIGGPFVERGGGGEFARGTDPSNPADARREPFPTATATRGR